MSCQFEKNRKGQVVLLKLKGEAETVPSKTKIESIVRGIINQESFVGESIEIKFCKNNKVEFRVGQSGDFQEIRENPESGQELKLKLTRIREQTFPKKNRTIRDILKHFKEKWPPKSPLAELFWYLAIFPLAVLTRIFRPKDIYDVRSAKWEKNRTDPKSVELATREVIELLKEGLSFDEPDTGVNQVVSCFEEGLDFVDSWRHVSKQQSIQMLCDKMISKFSEAEAGKVTTLAVIPVGYWKKGLFHPLQLIFYKNEQGLLCLKELGYEDVLNRNGKHYQFSSIDKLDLSKFQMMLNSLMEISTKPEAIPPPQEKDVIAAGYLAGLQMAFPNNSAENIIQPANLPIISLGSVEDYIEMMIGEAGGQFVPQVEQKDVSQTILKINPMALVQETLQNQFPDCNLSDKVSFTLHLLHSRMSKVIKALPHMKAKDRDFWLNKLKKDYSKLKRQIDKSELSEDILKVFDLFESNLNQINAGISNLLERQIAAQKKRSKKLDKVVDHEINLSIDAQNTNLSQTTTITNSRLTVEDLSNVQILSEAFKRASDDDIRVVVIKLKALTARVDALVAEKQYNTAIELFRHIMPYIPAPTDQRQEPTNANNEKFDGFWKKLVEMDDLKASQAALEISNELGKLSQFYWEAKMKTFNPLLRADEWVYMLQIEALLHQLIEVRKKILNSKDKRQLNLEERLFRKAAQNYKNDFRYGKGNAHLIDYEKYLRPCENPQIDEKFSVIKAYLNNVNVAKTSSGTFIPNPIYEKYSNELSICQAVIDAYCEDDPFNTLSPNDLWLRYYKREDANQRGRPFIPTQLGDLSRHQLILESMIYPETSIGRYGLTVKGMIQLARPMIAKYADPLKEHRRRYLETLKELSKFDRLEVNPILSLGGRIINWGIIPKGTDPSKGASFAITPGGMTDVQVVVSGARRTDIHSESLKHPSPLVGKAVMMYFDTEFQHLQESLSSDSKTPLDDYLLSVIYGRQRPDSNHIYSFSVHEVFDAILQRPWLLNRVSKNGDDIDCLEGQKRLYEVLFMPGWIKRALNESPEFFLHHAAPLRTLLNHFIENGNHVSYSFLLYLLDVVYHHIDQAILLEGDENKRIILNQIKNSWPHGSEKIMIPDQNNQNKLLQDIQAAGIQSNQGITFDDAAYYFWTEEKQFQQRIDGAAHFIRRFSNSIKAWDHSAPAGLNLNDQQEEIVRLLEMGSLLEMVKDEATIPVEAQLGVLWIQECLVPYIQLHKDHVSRGKLMDLWMHRQNLPVSASAEWVEVEGQPYVWKKIERIGQESKETIIDLMTLQVVSYRGKSSKGLKTKLPSEIIEHPDFVTIFGDQSFDAFVNADSTPGQYVYYFSALNSRTNLQDKYRVIYNKSTSRITFERLVNFRRKKGIKPTWCFYQKPKYNPPIKEIKSTSLDQFLDDSSEETSIHDESKSIEKCLLQRGIWVSREDPTVGKVFLGETVPSSGDNEEFGVLLSDKGKVVAVMSKDGHEVVHDPDQRLFASLPCLPQEQVLFLRKFGNSSVSQIRFLNQNFRLERNSQNQPWVFRSEDPDLDGGLWIVGDQELHNAHPHLRSLGVNFEQVGFVIKKGNQFHFLSWPQQALSDDLTKSGVKQVEFTKTLQLKSPLKISISEGNLSSSAAGYLQLAYLFSANNKYVEAAHYLEKASKTRIANDEELIDIMKLEDNFKKLPVNSKQSAMIQLKALLKIRQVFQEQSKRIEFNSHQWRNFLQLASDIQKTYSLYLELVEKSPFKTSYKNSEAIAGLSLTQDECNDLDHALVESLFFATADPAATNSEMTQVKFTSPSSTEIKITIPFFLSRMAPHLDDPNEELLKLSPDSPKILEHFFEFYNEIVNKKLTPKDLLNLFAPIPGQENFDKDLLVNIAKMDQAHFEKSLNQNKDLVTIAQMDVARRLLLSAAVQNMPKIIDKWQPDENGVVYIDPHEELESDSHQSLPQSSTLKPFDLNRLKALQKSLPTSRWGLAVQGALVALDKYNEAKDNVGPGRRNQILESFNEVCRIATLSIQKGIITKEGIEEDNPSNSIKNALELLGSERGISIHSMQRALNQDPTVFGPMFGPILHQAFNNTKFIQRLIAAAQLDINDSQAMDLPIPKDKIIEVIEQHTKINLLKVVRENEVQKRIASLENRVRTNPSKQTLMNFENPDEIMLKCDLMSPLSIQDEDLQIDPLFEQSPINRQMENLINLETAYKSSLTPLDSLANTKETQMALSSGINSSARTLEQSIFNQYRVKPNDLPALRTKISKHRDLAFKGAIEAKKALINYLLSLHQTSHLPKEVRWAIKYYDDIGEEALLSALKKSYQMEQLNDGSACKFLTEYLLQKAAYGVLSGPVEDLIKRLEILKKQQVSVDSNDWITTCSRLRELTTKALNYDRYFVSAENKTLLNGTIYRKILVEEASQGIILSEEQIALIKKMAANPFDWYELKVGLGKTSVVFPIILLILIQKGEFPVAMVKDELLAQNLDSLDRATRDLLERAGVEFSFRLNDPITSLELQEEYLKLLEVQVHEGYIITSIPSVIALEQKIQLLGEKLSHKLRILFEEGKNTLDFTKILKGMDAHAIHSENKNTADSSQIESLLEIDEIEKSLYYLNKIKEKLELIIIDEADDVLNIVCENNVGRGDPVILNESIQSVMQNVMRIIQTCNASPSTSTTNSPYTVFALKEALKNGTQASLSIEEVKKYTMPELVNLLLNDNQFLEKADLAGVNFNKDLLVEYLCCVYEDQEQPDIDAIFPSAQISKACKERLGALKKIVQVALPTALMQKPGIDAGIKKTDGYQIGPQVSGREKTGTVFSDEYDLLVNHYLYYAIQLPPPLPGQEPQDSFAEKALVEIRESQPYIYDEWLTQADGKNMIEFLNQPENYQERLTFLNLQIINEKRIKRFEKQIVFNVQSITHNRRIGGMTGTLNRSSMPRIAQQTSNHEANFASRNDMSIVAQVLLEAGVPETPTIEVISNQDVLQKLCEKAKMVTNKAIINQGYDLGEGDARTVVSIIRKTESVNRIFVYVDTDSRETYIWYPNADQPNRISKPDLNKLALEDPVFKEKCCFYFGPPDTRGTDFRIPPGKAAIFLAPQFSMDDLVQTLGRMRGAGSIHSADFIITDKTAERIKKLRNNQTISYPEIALDVIVQNQPINQSKNLKTAFCDITKVTSMGIRQLIFGNDEMLDHQNYWGSNRPVIRFFNNYIKMKLEELAAEKGWLEETRKVNLNNDFNPTIQEKTVDQLKRLYATEQEKLRSLKVAIAELKNDKALLAIPMALYSQNHPEIISLKSYDEDINGLIGRLEAQVEAMQKQLDTIFSEISSKLESEEDQSLSKQVPSNGAGIAASQEQVQVAEQSQQQQQQQLQQQQQEQQQSQEQQQLQQIQSKRIGEKSNLPAFHYFRVDPINAFENLPIANDPKFHDMLKIFDIQKGPDVSFLLSKNFGLLFNSLGGFKGNRSLCRLEVAVKRSANENSYNYQISLITKQDSYYDFVHQLDDPYFDVESHLKDDQFIGMNLYTFLNPKIYGVDKVLNRTIKNSTEDYELPEQALREIVKAKWLVGITDYSDKEMQLLNEWLLKVKETPEGASCLSYFLDNFGTTEQRKMVP